MRHKKCGHDDQQALHGDKLFVSLVPSVTDVLSLQQLLAWIDTVVRWSDGDNKTVWNTDTVAHVVHRTWRRVMSGKQGCDAHSAIVRGRSA